MNTTIDEPMRVSLEVFEGPLDLLLYLIKREEVDIYDVKIETITARYLEYLEQINQLDIEQAGDFLVMAATLLYLKSRTLLPVEQQPPEEETEEDDPRWELIRQLIEYKKFKEVAEELGQRERLEREVFYRQLPLPSSGKPPLDLSRVSMFDLVSAFQKILERAQKRQKTHDVVEDTFTVSQKIEYILDRVHQEGRVTFSNLFHETSTRGEIVVTFLALLELIRLKQLRAVQSTIFGEIDILAA